MEERRTFVHAEDHFVRSEWITRIREKKPKVWIISMILLLFVREVVKYDWLYIHWITRQNMQK